MRINEATLVQPIVAGVFDVSAGRLGAITAGLLGLVGVAISGRALARSDVSAAVVAAGLGVIAIVVGGLVVATSDGGLGTGNGLGGGIVAMVLGLLAIVLGGFARARRQKVA